MQRSSYNSRNPPSSKRQKVGPKPHKLEGRHCRNIRELRNVLLHKPITDDWFDYPRFDLDFGDGAEAQKSLSEVEQAEKEAPRRDSQERLLTPDGALDIDYEIFFAEILALLVTPRDEAGSADMSLLFAEDTEWLYEMLNLNYRMIVNELFSCTAIEYATHWKLFVYMESFFAIREELHKLYPALEDSLNAYTSSLEISKSEFLSIGVKKVSKGRLLNNIKCVSVDTSLNMKMKSSMSGMTVALAFIRSSSNQFDTPVRLMLVRSAHVDPDDILVDGSISKLDLRIIGHRATMETEPLRVGDYLHIRPLMQFCTMHRAFRSVHETCLLPFRLRSHLFGKRIPQVPGMIPAFCKKARDPTPNPVDHSTLRDSLDEGVLRYLDHLYDSGFCNERQKAALETCLNEFSSMKEFSGSLSLIHGPPGTGKTRVALALLGCVLNSSVYGYLGTEEATSRLTDVDGRKVMRADDMPANKTGGKQVRVLFCAPSNAAVDKIAEQIRDSGIVDIHTGETVYPDMIRVGKDQHEYGDLEKYSIESALARYEDELRAGDVQSSVPSKGNLQVRKDGENGTTDSKAAESDPAEETSKSAALRKIVGRAVVFLATNSTAGSGHFQDLKASCNLIIMDEAANCSEPDALVPIATTAKTTNSLHVVLIGDHHQLGAVSKSRPSLKSLSKTVGPLPFQFDKLFPSLFERMKNERLAAATALTHQYRTNPHIGAVQTPPFYDSLIVHPDILPVHLASFNQPDIFKGAFQPLTIIDKSVILSCSDSGGEQGNLINSVEAEQVNSTLFRIYNITVREGDVDTLPGQLAVITPYRAQVAFLQEYLQRGGKFLSNRERKNFLKVEIATVDRLQGSERHVVIISFVRSNTTTMIGFLRNDRRLNVATSRARKLMVMIGDSTTLNSTEKWKHFWDVVVRGSVGTALIVAEPENNNDRNYARADELSKLLSGPKGGSR